METFLNIRLIISMIKTNIKTNLRYPLDTLSLLIRPIIGILPLIFFSNYIGNQNNQFYRYTCTTNYIQYITISFFFIAFMSNCIVSSSILITSELEKGTFENIILSPIKPVEYVMTYITSVFLVHFINFFIFYFTIVCIFDKIIVFQNLYLLIYVFFLSMIISFGIGTLLAGLTIKTKLTKVTYMINSTLILLAGVSYPIDVFPNSLKFLALCNPITYCVDLARYSILGGKIYFNLPTEIIIASFISIIILIIGVVIFNNILKNLKSTGNLTNY